MKKTRKRLPGLIRNAPNTEVAAALAIYGESPPTGKLFDFLSTFFWCSQSGLKLKPFKALFLDKLWEAFAPAIVDLNPKPFLEAAEAVRRIEDLCNNQLAADPLRLYLISWKRSRKRPTLPLLRKNFPRVMQGIDERHIRRVAAEVGLKIRTVKRHKPA